MSTVIFKKPYKCCFASNPRIGYALILIAAFILAIVKRLQSFNQQAACRHHQETALEFSRNVRQGTDVSVVQAMFDKTEDYFFAASSFASNL